MTEWAIRADGLTKVYPIVQAATAHGYDTLREALVRIARRPFSRRERQGSITVLDDVTFDVARGDVVAVIGRNGAGKSTLLKILSRIVEPTRGRAEIRGRTSSLLEVGTGFHPELTGRENVYLNGTILGMTRREIRTKIDEIVSFAGVEQFLDVPVKRYSSGMQLRLGFSVAAHLDPEILFVDEVLAVGDAEFQKKCLGKMDQVASAGRTVLFVSHDLAAAERLCKSGLLLERGRIAKRGTPREVIDAYHRALADTPPTDLAARPDRRGDGRVKFCGLEIEVDGHVAPAARTGCDLALKIDVEATEPLRTVVVHVALFDGARRAIGFLGSDVTDARGESLSVPQGRSRIVVSLPRLPLLPDTYSLNLFCRADGGIADWVQDAATLQVIDGDIYGSGKLPPQGYGSFAIACSFSAEDAA